MNTAEDSAPPVILVQDISKVYDMGAIQVRALDGVSIQIDAGEFVAIMGASGSGKSTLMNIIGCLDVPTAGTYHLDGESIAELSADRLADIRSRKVGFVFQTHNLLPRLTALANVELPMVYGKWPRRRERAQEALALVGLGDRMDHRPTELSGGQQQRVGIARALVKDPAILLADEPTGNLDTSNSQEILQLITELNRETGITVVVVTHEPEIAARTGRTPRRADWRLVREIFVADSDAEAWDLSVGGMMGRMMGEYFLPLLAEFGFQKYFKHDPDVPDADITVEYCARHNWLIGSPDTVVRRIEDVYAQVGGFGTLLVFGFDYAERPEAWRHSLELIAREVAPRVAHLTPE